MVLELKGIGHPDVVTDRLSNVAIGVISKVNDGNAFPIHANFDKCYLKSGKTPILYIGGNIALTPMIDFEKLKQQISNAVVEEFYSMFESNIQVEFILSTTHSSLARSTTEKLSNDTSYITAFYPLKDIEKRVLLLDNFLKNVENRRKFNIGSDYKIMVVDSEIFISQCFLKHDYDAFEEYKIFVNNHFKYCVDNVSKVYVNIDEPKFGLWVQPMGSSLFSNDCGQNGRGNDFYGFSSPDRPSNNEAHSGKNKNHPASYLYDIAFHEARKEFQTTGKATKVTIISKIGQKLDNYTLIKSYI